MSQSRTTTQTRAFTETHARYIASKVKTDLKRMQRIYDNPTGNLIELFDEEMTEILKAGYLDTVWYGFKRNEIWIEPTLIYTGQDLERTSAADDEPGRIKLGCNIREAYFGSFLKYNAAFHGLSDQEKIAFENRLPLSRSGAAESEIDGYIESDRTYSAGGWALNRSSVRKL